MLLAIHTSTRANVFIAKLVHKILASLALHTFFPLSFHSLDLPFCGFILLGAMHLRGHWRVCPQNLLDFLGNTNPEFHGTVRRLVTLLPYQDWISRHLNQIRWKEGFRGPHLVSQWNTATTTNINITAIYQVLIIFPGPVISALTCSLNSPEMHKLMLGGIK